tara:strand:+ start:15957 stop:17759 length:1803 start_codon:yes stop_codon:yes gene_type:complete
LADNKISLAVSLKDQASQGLDKLRGSLGSFGKLLNGTALAVAALGAAFTKLAFSAASAGDDFAKTATRIGTTAQTLSQLTFAAEIGGAGMSTVATSLRILSRRVNDANNGLMTSVRSFSQAGIAVRKHNGELKNAEELLLDAADAFKDMENPIERTALAMELFGRSGGDLVPVINIGKEGIKDLMQEAEQLGLTFNEVEAKQAEDFQDALLRLKSVFIGLGRTIGKVLIPIFTVLFDFVRISLLPLLGFLKTSIDLLGIAFTILFSPIRAIIDFFQDLRNKIRGLTNVGDKLRNFFIKLFNEDIPSEEELENRKKKVQELLGVIEDFEPPTSILGADIAGISPSMEAAAEKTKGASQALSEFGANAKQAEEGLRLGFKEAFDEAFPKEGGTLDQAKKFGETVADNVITAIDDVGLAMASAVLDGENFMDSLKSIFKGLARMIVQQVAIMIARLIALRIAMAAVGMGPAGMGGFGMGIGGGLGGIISGFTKGIGSVAKGLKKISPFADGGRPPLNQPSLVGERGPELFVPDSAGTIVPNEMLGGMQSIGVVNILPNASIDKALTDKPMSFWVDLTQQKILPALNNLGQSGSTTTLNFRKAR